MNDISELFWNASLEEIKRGYIYQKDTEKYCCLICGFDTEKGVIYKEKDEYHDAEKSIVLHIEKEHKSMFHYLLDMDKKITGFTDHQKVILELFYDGFSDNEIVEKLGGGSNSTIRNYRFSFKEKAKSAKIIFALMELLDNKSPKKQRFVTIHKTAKQIDERYAITEDESEKILKKYLIDGVLTEFPSKEKRKLVILKYIASKFDKNRKYSEKEVNEIIKAFYHDYVTIRRYLIEYGFLDRVKDCSQYWLKV